MPSTHVLPEHGQMATALATGRGLRPLGGDGCGASLIASSRRVPLVQDCLGLLNANYFLSHALVTVTLLLGFSTRWASTITIGPNFNGNLCRNDKSSHRSRQV